MTRALPMTIALLLSGCSFDLPVPDDEGLPVLPRSPAPDDPDNSPDDPDEPPVEEPPVEEPPVEEPPVEEPPVEEPPVEEPPVEEPPVEEPPVAGPVTTPPEPSCERVRVINTGGVTLNVRPSPATSGAPVGSLPEAAVVDVLGVVERGEDVGGVTRWYEIDDGVVVGFISGAFAACVDPSARIAGFFLPLACGRTATVTQGNSSPFSHNGFYGTYAFDFGLPRGTSLRAMEDGVVVAVSGATGPDSPCWQGGGPDCINAANYVVLHHADNTQTGYVHLDAPTVVYGQHVARGAEVGLSGGTGYSTGPHAHVQRQVACPESVFCETLEMRFADVGGDGIPNGGDTVTSGNCP